MKFFGTISKSGQDPDGMIRYIIVIPKSENKEAEKYHGLQKVIKVEDF